jgi:UDP-N-acetylmuramoyl-tripeptide--D-alanyl-D-alanine ligase
MRTEEAIVEAKAEILTRASVAVLNVDDPRLAQLADRVEAGGKRVVRCSARDVEGVPEGVALTNAACAAAVALELGVPPDVVRTRLADLPAAEHRLTATLGSGGFVIVDDTYNANPAGAQAALAALARVARPEGKQVLVTPGMVELGPRQAEENRKLAAAAVARCTHVVVVGHTNRQALLEGTRGGRAEVLMVETRDDAVAWVREHLREGDAVLYENDLPDHFP